MNFIYYYVSGEYMEILQNLLSFFINEYNGGKFKPLFELLKNNSFDIKKALSNLNLDAIAPVIQEFMKNVGTPNQNYENSFSESFGLNPIAKIADKDIVYTLNQYFYSP